MRRLLLAAAIVLSGPLAAQTLAGGLGVAGWGSDTEMMSIGGAVTAPVGAWTVGAYSGYSEEIVLSRSWWDWEATGAVLVGRSGREGAVEWLALAGPSLTRALRQPNVSPVQPSEPGFEPGVMARARGTVTPFRAVPIGVMLDLGVNVSTKAVTTSVLPGLAVRLGG